MLAHALAILGNRRLGKKLNAERAAVIAMYHDATEIITGDMPTPIKYLNKDIKGAFKDIESQAARPSESLSQRKHGREQTGLIFYVAPDFPSFKA